MTSFVPQQISPAWFHPTASAKIQRVVIVIQENRSFNNHSYGYTGTKTAKYGYDSRGPTHQPLGYRIPDATRTWH